MSSSASPTPTASSPPPPPTSGFSSIFQSAGGPPLILVCIAAGLLLGSFVGMFLIKRLRPAVVVHRVNGAALSGEMRLGEKPKLYDVYLGPSAVAGGQDSEHPWAHTSLAVAVSMPNPSLNAPKTVDITDDDCHDDPMPDCCIGTTILPYQLETV
ncbi:hypothetical protein C2E23DRAFT_885868 [Lenzites betulinus]|nr:hypothetical protein C2E23DRAFT_885868 [Lenzites betulinus]